MATTEDTKPRDNEGDEPSAAEPDADRAEKEAIERADPTPADEAPLAATAPTQLGYRRFVYAAYFAGAIAVAFIASKTIDFAWLKIASYKPAIGEPHDEYVMPAAGLIGVIAAVYYWRRTRARQLAEEVASELSKVTWPGRTEVTNSTFVVIVTTLVATTFFALMDRFWGFVTNLVYGT